MTGNIFIDAGIIFLMVYACIHICYEIGTYLVEKFSSYRHRDFLILLLSTGAEAIEMDVRMAIKRSVDLGCSLLIVDLGLTPSEQMILYCLADPYHHIILASRDDVGDKIRIADAVNAAL